MECRQPSPACEVGLDGGDVDVDGCSVAVVGAQQRDVPHLGRLGLVEEGCDLAGVPHAHHRCHQINTVGLFEGLRIGDGVVPVKEQITAVPRRSTGRHAVINQIGGNQRAGAAAATEDER